MFFPKEVQAFWFPRVTCLLVLIDLLQKAFRHREHTPATGAHRPGGSVPGEKVSLSQRSQWALWLGKGALMQEVQ